MSSTTKRRDRFWEIKTFAAEHGDNSLTWVDARWLITEVERLREELRAHHATPQAGEEPHDV